MTDYTKLPIVLINNYLWALASGSVSGYAAVPSAVWNTSTYEYKPFYPIDENLTPNSTTMPYVLYDFMFRPPDGTLWPINKERAIYSIIGDIPQIFYVKNFIFDTLRKFDKTASDVNNYINDPDIKFKSIHVYQDNFVLDEKRIDSYKAKYITTLTLSYEYTK